MKLKLISYIAKWSLFTHDDMVNSKTHFSWPAVLFRYKISIAKCSRYFFFLDQISKWPISKPAMFIWIDFIFETTIAFKIR